MSREALMRKITTHLTDVAKKSPVQQLQDDMAAISKARLEEVLTIKMVNGTVKESDLIKVLRQKNLTISDVIDSDGKIVQSELSKVNIQFLKS